MKLVTLGAFGTAAILGIATLSPAADARAGERQEYDITNFDSIDVSGGIEVIFTQDSAYLVDVESLDGGFDKIEIKREDGDLVIKRPGRNWNMGKQPRYKVYVSAPELEEVEVASGSSFRSNEIKTGDFELEVSSGASAMISSLTAENVELDASSGASIEVAGGSCDEVSADASSGSSIMAGELACDSMEADVSSGASIIGRASNDVSADASSGGSVTVYGDPDDTTIDKSSGGSVTIKG